MYKRVLSGRVDVYTSLVDLCNWMSILLRRSLTGDDITEAERLCKEWRKNVVNLIGVDACRYPNFHNVLHMFVHIRKWGPPILWWTRPFGKNH